MKLLIELGPINKQTRKFSLKFDLSGEKALYSACRLIILPKERLLQVIVYQSFFNCIFLNQWKRKTKPKNRE